MAAKKNKPSPPAKERVITVAKFKYLTYKGRIMRYSRLVKLLKLDPFTYREKFNALPRLPYDGIMGAPLKDTTNAIQVAQTLLHELDKDQWGIDVRFRVMYNDTIAPDKPFDFKKGCYPKCDNEGFANRKLAFIAAEEHYKTLESFMKDGLHGKDPTNKVRLILEDSKGNVVKVLSNQRKILRSDSKRAT